MEFAIETILTILTGVAFEQGLDNAKNFIEYMTGEPASELTFVAGIRPELCKKEIFRQHPKLKRVLEWRNIDKTNYNLYLQSAIDNFGATLTIEPIENMPSPKDCLGQI